jgi:hypothetical protein
VRRRDQRERIQLALAEVERLDPCDEWERVSIDDGPNLTAASLDLRAASVESDAGTLTRVRLEQRADTLYERDLELEDDLLTDRVLDFWRDELVSQVPRCRSSQSVAQKSSWRDA